MQHSCILCIFYALALAFALFATLALPLHYRIITVPLHCCYITTALILHYLCIRYSTNFFRCTRAAFCAFSLHYHCIACITLFLLRCIFFWELSFVTPQQISMFLLYRPRGEKHCFPKKFHLSSFIYFLTPHEARNPKIYQTPWCPCVCVYVCVCVTEKYMYVSRFKKKIRNGSNWNLAGVFKGLVGRDWRILSKIAQAVRKWRL